MRRLVIAVSVIVAAVVSAPDAQASTTITVRGGWISDAAGVVCNPASVKAGPGFPPGSVTRRCIGGQAVDGSFMGHSVVTTAETIYTSGAISGTFDEWLYATYWGGLATGGLHVIGTYSVAAADGAFVASGTIVGGTCDFAGSTGTLSSSGYVLNGGYSGTWTVPRDPSSLGTPGVCAAVPTLP